MRLIDQAAERVTLARRHGREPLRWIANDAAAAELAVDGELHGLPLLRGEPRSEWGLELVCSGGGA